MNTPSFCERYAPKVELSMCPAKNDGSPLEDGSIFDINQNIVQVEKTIAKMEKEIKQVQKNISLVETAFGNINNSSWFAGEGQFLSYLQNCDIKERTEKLNNKELSLNNKEMSLNDQLKLLREEKNLLLKNSFSLAPPIPPRRELVTKEITDFALDASPKSFLNQEKEPMPFVCQDGWLESVTKTIVSNMPRTDKTGRSRVPPMVLSRCSRGGKTRSLHEISEHLRNLDSGLITLVVTFNGGITEIDDYEQLDPLLALTRRIAFAASNVEKTPRKFDEFRDYAVTPQSIQDWLSGKKVVLLIDELNILTNINQQTALDNKTRNFAKFIKSNFLDCEGRYFVFSTHELQIVPNLYAYLDSKSDRPVEHVQLPLIPSLQSARKSFQMLDLSAKQALFCGQIPGLILMKKDKTFPKQKRDEAIRKLLRNDVGDKVVIDILSSMIDGKRRDTLKPIEELMDVTDKGKLKWIPEHMTAVLDALSEDARVSSAMRDHLDNICELFKSFKKSKKLSGDGWEALFALTLLVRIITRKSCDLINLPPVDFSSVSFNFAFDSLSFDDITDANTFMERVPDNYGESSHVALYFPSNACFENFELFVVMWRSGVRARTIGYQLKESATYPKKGPGNTFDENFLIQGEARRSSNDDLRGWKRASDSQIDEFFGISGAFWTPKKWKELHGEQEEKDT